jgi:hypothetical protein
MDYSMDLTALSMTLQSVHHPVGFQGIFFKLQGRQPGIRTGSILAVRFDATWWRL